MLRPRIDRSLKIEELEPRIAPAALAGADSSLSEEQRQEAMQSFSAMPFSFVENQGQISDPEVRYVYQGKGANILFTASGPIFQVYQSKTDDSPDHPGDEAQPDSAVQAVVFRSSVVGGREVEPVGVNELPGRVNYLIGNDPSAWHTDLATYATIKYEAILDGIDLYLSGSRALMKYEFHVAPGANPDEIAIQYEGIEGLSIDDAGPLRIRTALGEITDDAPYIYQDIAGARVPIAGAFRLIGQSSYGFEITGSYDATQPLVVDPGLIWSTFLGGEDADAGYGIAVQDGGIWGTFGDGVYVTGETCSVNFPTATPTSGKDPFDTSYNLNTDVFVSKLTLDGTTLVYSTFLGGTEPDGGRAIALDGTGGAYVTGYTMSGPSGTVPGSFPMRGGIMTKRTMGFVMPLWQSCTTMAPIYAIPPTWVEQGVTMALASPFTSRPRGGPTTCT
jgi:hypothetical protein